MRGHWHRVDDLKEKTVASHWQSKASEMITYKYAHQMSLTLV